MSPILLHIFVGFSCLFFAVRIAYCIHRKNNSMAGDFCLTSSNKFLMDHRITHTIDANTRKDAHILTATSSRWWINMGDINALIFALEIVFTFSYNLNSISFSYIAVMCTHIQTHRYQSIRTDHITECCKLKLRLLEWFSCQKIFAMSNLIHDNIAILRSARFISSYLIWFYVRHYVYCHRIYIIRHQNHIHFTTHRASKPRKTHPKQMG